VTILFLKNSSELLKNCHLLGIPKQSWIASPEAKVLLIIICSAATSYISKSVTSHCDRFWNIEAYLHKSLKKKKVKPSILKLSKNSRIVTAFRRHKTESQCGSWALIYLRQYFCWFYIFTVNFTNSKKAQSVK
jgi:hypothetical protein